MKIQFLKECKAPQEVYRTRCDCCGPQLEGMQEQYFFKDEVIDPEELYYKTDLSGLTYQVDYVITEYP